MQSFWAKYIYFTLYINRFYNKRLWLTSNVRSLQENLKPPFCRIDLAVARVTTTRSRFKTLRGQGWRRALASHPGVARVRFPDPASYVGWVCCWFSTLLWEVFLLVLRFSPLLKKPTLPNSNSILEWAGISNEFLWTPWVNKLHLLF